MSIGVVRARDVDKDGIDAPWLAEKLRQMGAAGDRRLAGGGYIIFNRRITSPDFKVWKAYGGSNPHTHHLHVSFSRNQAGFDSTAPWDFGAPLVGPPPVPATSGPGVLSEGMSGPEIERLQKFLNRCYPAYSKLVADGQFGPATKKVIVEFQRRAGLTADGIVGPATRRALNF